MRTSADGDVDAEVPFEGGGEVSGLRSAGAVGTEADRQLIPAELEFDVDLAVCAEGEAHADGVPVSAASPDAAHGK